MLVEQHTENKQQTNGIDAIKLNNKKKTNAKRQANKKLKNPQK